MNLHLPPHPALDSLTEQEALLDLACSLYARGKLGIVGAADLAGVGLTELQRALAERRIPLCDAVALEADGTSLQNLFRR
jgi:predicted HTH domain antitoxin